MKKLFLVGALALFGAVNAQTYGLKAGMNLSNVSNFEEAKSKIGLNVGGFMNAPIAEGFSIQPELLYNMKGAKWTSGGETATAALDYLSLPIMFQYNATPEFYLEAGPELSLLLSAKAKGGGATVDMKEYTNSFDFGLGLGAGYYFTPNIGVNARYVAGLTDIAKENSGDASKNSVFQVGLSYKFGN